MRAGFIFGGAGGNGALLVRDNPGTWSYPAFYTVASGSVGLQAGAEVAEVILMIRSQRGADAMLSNSFKVGTDASVAAGPVGAGAQVQTSDILAFSRSKGALWGRQSGWLGDFAPRRLELDLLWAAGPASGYPGQPQCLQRTGRQPAQPLGRKVQRLTSASQLLISLSSTATWMTAAGISSRRRSSSPTGKPTTATNEPCR